MRSQATQYLVDLGQRDKPHLEHDLSLRFNRRQNAWMRPSKVARDLNLLSRQTGIVP
jgi:hypothetical protein